MPEPTLPDNPDAAKALSAEQPLTVGGPAIAPRAGADKITRQKASADGAARAMPENVTKIAEHGRAHALQPPPGRHMEAGDPLATASTVTEDTASAKLGDGAQRPGRNPTNGALDRVRVDSTSRALSTNQGVPIADNQNSLKAGLRGPTLMEDFILREKITHFDHERIPERVVHARGSGAHGVFECYEGLAELTRASLFAQAGKRTPVFVRFSTVVGERGSMDTARDTRGFAVKFYTDEGNWDLVGNNIPVFFIQDAMKFPDVVHAAKPEPHHQMPQASSAHDTFWDFMSLTPETVHHTLWVMSDRGIPRSYRTMQGFGVNTYRLVDAKGRARFVKFHWLPLAGTHSLVWDEAVKIGGADPDFHRRDLWEAIEAGHFPQWELAVQVFTEEQAESFTFDVLDATKIVPEELVPLRPVGRLTLNRNPDNFFAETEQVAFCVAHVVPGIDFSNDPLLQGRIHSYLDTQLSRLGGPNFHEIPINAPLAEVHNNQREGMHRQAIHRGRVNYEPNSLAAGCPYQAGAAGFVSFAERITEDKLRAKPEKFADHYSQAALFWRSQTPVEQQHIVAAFRFELSRVTVPAVRERVVSVLANVDAVLARRVADALGMPVPQPQPRGTVIDVRSEVETSAGLSLFARPGDGSIAGRRVAVIVADGFEAEPLLQACQALSAAQAMPRLLGMRLGQVRAAGGAKMPVDGTIETMPSVLWDAMVLAGGAEALPALCADGKLLEFVRDQYRHCKPMLVLGRDAALLRAAGIPMPADASDDPGLIFAGEVVDDGDDDDRVVDDSAVAGDAPPEPAPGVPAAQARDLLEKFVVAIGRHRHFERELDPPAV